MIELSLPLWSGWHQAFLVLAANTSDYDILDDLESETSLWVWHAIPGLFMVQYYSEPDTVYWVGKDAGELWLLTNAPAAATIGEVTHAEHPSIPRC